MSRKTATFFLGVCMCLMSQLLHQKRHLENRGELALSVLTNFRFLKFPPGPRWQKLFFLRKYFHDDSPTVRERITSNFGCKIPNELYPLISATSVRIWRRRVSVASYSRSDHFNLHYLFSSHGTFTPQCDTNSQRKRFASLPPKKVKKKKKKRTKNPPSIPLRSGTPRTSLYSLIKLR